MTDHAVLIPTASGPVGGIVSAPTGDTRAGMLLLAGYGRPARSGTNAFWTRAARALADRGVTALRVDLSSEGETLSVGQEECALPLRLRLDLQLLQEVTSWFSERLPGLPQFVGGVCGGGRQSIELAASEPGVFSGIFTIVPELSGVARPEGVGGELPGDLHDLDPWALESLRANLARTPHWILVGEHDDGYCADLPELLEPAPHPLEVEIVPDLALHFLDHPDIHEQAQQRLTARVDRALAVARTTGHPRVVRSDATRDAATS